MYTQDSFKDDILKQDKNQKLVEEDNPINLINDKEINEKSIILKEKERNPGNDNKKLKIFLIIFFLILMLAGISIALYFFK